MSKQVFIGPGCEVIATNILRKLRSREREFGAVEWFGKQDFYYTGKKPFKPLLVVSTPSRGLVCEMTGIFFGGNKAFLTPKTVEVGCVGNVEVSADALVDRLFAAVRPWTTLPRTYIGEPNVEVFQRGWWQRFRGLYVIRVSIQVAAARRPAEGETDSYNQLKAA